jgi:ketol-acid reductoisomerase
MKGLLADIQSGAFAKRFIEDQNNGRKQFEAFRALERQHPIEKVGAELRAGMPFLDPVKVVNGAVVKA